MKLTGTKTDTARFCLMDLLGVDSLEEGQKFSFRDQDFVVKDGILRSGNILSATQGQTCDAFAYIWEDQSRFESRISKDKLRAWYAENYGDVANAPWWPELGSMPILFEAGCGAGLSGTLTFGERLHKVRYLGVDVSSAVDVAQKRFSKLGYSGEFMQVDLMQLPIPEQSVDVIYSQGVLHHTDSTEKAVHTLAGKLKPGGRFLFYVYRRKGPVREFTDGHIRGQLQSLSLEEAWKAMLPLTKLGQKLGDLGIEIDIPEPIDLLDIPAGPINIQRLFYWHVFKAFHDPELSLEELNHINLDWYAPANAHRQTVEEVRSWCSEAGLEIEREHVQLSGISIIALKSR